MGCTATEWDVVYCSVPTSPGGNYRTAIGRLIFKTNEMVQVVEAPDIVRNQVSFSLFGFIDGQVSLKGKFFLDYGATFFGSFTYNAYYFHTIARYSCMLNTASNIFLYTSKAPKLRWYCVNFRILICREIESIGWKMDSGYIWAAWVENRFSWIPVRQWKWGKVGDNLHWWEN